jgi:hypothetical protein
MERENPQLVVLRRKYEGIFNDICEIYSSLDQIDKFANILSGNIDMLPFSCTWISQVNNIYKNAPSAVPRNSWKNYLIKYKIG